MSSRLSLIVTISLLVISNSDSLRYNLNWLLLGMRIKKSSYVAWWPSKKIWSIMADFWAFLNRFCVSGVIPMLRRSCDAISFTIISCAVATTRTFTNKMRAKVFRNTSLNLNKLDRRLFDWNAFLNEQESSWFLIQLLNLFLIWKDEWLKMGELSIIAFSQPFDKFFGNIKFIKKLFNTTIN